MKRVFDVIVSLVLLVILLPLILIIAFTIRLKLGTPIIYKQLRPGLKHQPFYFYKFRSMTDETDERGNLLPDERRLTKIGMFLRKYSLDEMPQLVNVLKGDLSLVGPRPLLMEYLPLYSTEHRHRHDVRPGITGWAQINGRNGISWEEKFNLDVWYVHHQSFTLDLKILMLTLVKVIKSEGINQPGNVTIERFRGYTSKVNSGHD